METYEYKTVDIVGFMDPVLNELGAEGWKVVAVVPEDKDSGYNPAFLMMRGRS